MDNLPKLEERRLALYENYKKESRKGIMFLLIGLIFIISGVLLELDFLFILCIIPIVVGAIFSIKSGKYINQFKSMFKNELILTLLQQQFESPYYDQHEMISLSRILSTKMVKSPDRHHGEDYISGVYKGVKFEVSDIDLKERVETRDSKGNVQVSYQTYFKGRWYIYTFERMFKEILRIQEGRGYGMNAKGLTKIETESIEFNKKFSIFASTQEYGFYHITSSMIEKLLELEKMHRGTILYCYMNNELHIGVNDSRDYMELSIKTPINPESLKDFQADIDLIPAIINELRLNGQKFKN